MKYPGKAIFINKQLYIRTLDLTLPTAYKFLRVYRYRIDGTSVFLNGEDTAVKQMNLNVFEDNFQVIKT